MDLRSSLEKGVWGGWGVGGVRLGRCLPGLSGRCVSNGTRVPRSESVIKLWPPDPGRCQESVNTKSVLPRRQRWPRGESALTGSICHHLVGGTGNKGHHLLSPSPLLSLPSRLLSSPLVREYLKKAFGAKTEAELTVATQPR